MERASTPSISLLGAEDRVELAVVACSEINSIAGENFQASDPNLGHEQILQTQRAGWRKCEGAVQQHGIDPRFRLRAQFFDLRFTDAVPVFDRGFQIAFEKINAAKEIVAIRIGRIET